MAKAKVPLVLDLSHHDEVEDWGKVYASGIRGVIHKATQGGSFVDGDYAKRKAAAKAAGLLFGAYHFADASDVTKQVEHFLSVAGTEPDTLLALDYEPNRTNTMSLAQAKQFLQLVYDKTGQRPIIYSGNLLKEQLKKADPFFSSHRLWLAQYGPKARLPNGFSSYWLWQYSGDGVNGSGIIPGIKTKGVDCNVFGGSDLAAEWCHVPAKPAPIPVPERADATVASLKDKSRTVATLVKAKVTSAAVAATSVVAGVTTDTTTTVAPVPNPVDVINLDTLHKTSDGLTAVQTIASTAKSLAIAFAINEWVLVAILGIAAFIIADKMLNWRLEEYIWGRWHPKEEG
ncbi:MAG TPA: glycoside hydrolase family 25 protein [Lacipirellulaceae bacterium]|nr:glycoside hydrolase family 25 protein [Lacipirellulaceae bacterium]